MVGNAKRGAYLSWLAYYAGVFEPAFMSAYMKWEIPRGTAGWVPVSEAMAFITATLGKGPCLLGDSFSAADILFGTSFKMFMGSPMLEKTELLESLSTGCWRGPPMPAPRPRKMADLINLRKPANRRPRRTRKRPPRPTACCTERPNPAQAGRRGQKPGGTGPFGPKLEKPDGDN